MKFSKTLALKLGIVFLLCSLFSFSSQAQLPKKSKVFLTFVETADEINAEGVEVLKLFNEVLKEQTNCVLLDKKETSEYVFQLRVVDQSMGDSKAKLEIYDNKTNALVAESNWFNGTANSRYAFSSPKHAMCRIIKSFLLTNNEDLIKKKE
ncbi:MAG: hypothetical protein WBG43_05420 [Marinifilaceae bacterium]